MVSQFKLPLLSTFATSEELSDKSRFQYFSRLVPPDSIATEAMTQLMIEFEWSYIQLLYAEGSYGENAAKGVEKNAKKRGICIGYSYRLNADDSNDYEAIAKKLIEHKKARVIAMIAGSYYMRNILTAIEKISKGEQFIFMVVDSFGRISNYEHRQNGTLQIIYDGGIDHDFANYMYSLKPQQAKHHWEKQLWEKLGRCNYTLDATDPTSCLKHSNFSNTTLYPYSSSAVKYSDGVEVYAKAIKDLIESSCPDAFNNKSLLKVIDQFF
ncbi:unnamed protein product [Dimorphilus gyrociliatus]|uniref:Receptor ligand binding region domain-containing protein n=1 Tax=Dimorphilus gyrociliatus TaxID=2664684 RepID=A0A7I8V539_9ANNE|nr:unnamed protein product [Dimorphilus gyrociliatus]